MAALLTKPFLDARLRRLQLCINLGLDTRLQSLQLALTLRGSHVLRERRAVVTAAPLRIALEAQPICVVRLGQHLVVCDCAGNGSGIFHLGMLPAVARPRGLRSKIGTQSTQACCLS